MGVHPGCPVCLIVAALLVAVETDVGETISATKVAFLCGLWSVGVVSLLSAGTKHASPSTDSIIQKLDRIAIGGPPVKSPV